MVCKVHSMYVSLKRLSDFSLYFASESCTRARQVVLCTFCGAERQAETLTCKAWKNAHTSLPNIKTHRQACLSSARRSLSQAMTDKPPAAKLTQSVPSRACSRSALGSFRLGQKGLFWQSYSCLLELCFWYLLTRLKVGKKNFSQLSSQKFPPKQKSPP